ncbi:uncharacterized protein Pyn_07741 [Prunus yedoensis var. nudiflora]|uniref:Uncharacterized protein n=1 Tax=Prunus yedoensis var. nudiflora TaxID=2094558 RepID=A0A314ZSZ6_PRUYE|nr:uncharacterized protein Pyn_07741 [Prunus yedoensis var. nudiflora]
MFVDVKADIGPNKGVVIEELDDNYGAIVPVGGKCKQWRQQKKKTSVVIEELIEDQNGEQSGGGKEKAVKRESYAVQKDKERDIERESPATVDKGLATVDKGKSKASSAFGKRRARAFGKRRCKNVKKTRDKEDQRSNTVTEGPVQKEVVEGTVEKSNLSRCHPMKTRKARTRTTVCHDEEEP